MKRLILQNNKGENKIDGEAPSDDERHRIYLKINIKDGELKDIS